MMNTALRRAWVPAILWLVVIALESTSLASAENTSKALLSLLTFLFGKISPGMFVHIHYGVRKAGHFFGYAVLSLMMFRAWWATLSFRAGSAEITSWGDTFRRWMPRAALLALLSTVAVAGLDEWHQASLVGRTGNVRDVALDSLGGAFAQLLLIALSSVRRQRTTSPLAVSR